MSYLWLVLAVAAINFASRISFLARPGAKSSNNRFLEVFPVALFVSLAARDLIAKPASSPVRRWLPLSAPSLVVWSFAGPSWASLAPPSRSIGSLAS